MKAKLSHAIAAECKTGPVAGVYTSLEQAMTYRESWHNHLKQLKANSLTNSLTVCASKHLGFISELVHQLSHRGDQDPAFALCWLLNLDTLIRFSQSHAKRLQQCDSQLG